MTCAGVPPKPRQDVRLTGLSVPPADSLAVSDIVAREALRDQGKPLARARVGHRRQTEPHDPAAAGSSPIWMSMTPRPARWPAT